MEEVLEMGTKPEWRIFPLFPLLPAKPSEEINPFFFPSLCALSLPAVFPCAEHCLHLSQPCAVGCVGFWGSRNNQAWMLEGAWWFRRVQRECWDCAPRGLGGFPTVLPCWPKSALAGQQELCQLLDWVWEQEISVRLGWKIPEVLTGQLLWQLAPKNSLIFWSAANVVHLLTRNVGIEFHLCQELLSSEVPVSVASSSLSKGRSVGCRRGPCVDKLVKHLSKHLFLCMVQGNL